MQRRRRLEKGLDRQIISPTPSPFIPSQRSESYYPARVPIRLNEGLVIIGSDAHYWPGEASCAHRAFVRMIKEMSPDVVILNGDIFDGARISRHPRIGWSRSPTVKEELEAVDERTSEIEAVARGSRRIWTIGNHDARFENRLSADAHEFEDVPGFCLKDRFPKWELVTSVWVNDDVVIKHRFKGGIHATHNNALWSGKTTVTGHLHSLKVTPLSDYCGTRWGVDTGTLAEPYGPHTEYTEDNPLNHRSGFVVLTFARGILLWPEIVRVVDENHVDFRGKLIEV
jgi:hypothetical protein